MMTERASSDLTLRSTDSESSCLFLIFKVTIVVYEQCAYISLTVPIASLTLPPHVSCLMFIVGINPQSRLSTHLLRASCYLFVMLFTSPVPTLKFYSGFVTSNSFAIKKIETKSDFIN